MFGFFPIVTQDNQKSKLRLVYEDGRVVQDPSLAQMCEYLNRWPDGRAILSATNDAPARTPTSRP